MPQPIEWSLMRLGEVTRPTKTWNPRSEPRETIRYVDVSAISREELRVLNAPFIPAATAPSRARKIVRTGDTVFATVRPTLKRIAQIPASFDREIVSTAFCVLRPDRAKVNPEFLFFAVQQEPLMAEIAALETGASYPAVRDSDVLNQLIPVPSLWEQQSIAAVLSAIRAAFLHEAECEAVSVALKQTAMRELFTRGLRGEAQKETEVGPMPESWDLTPCEQIFKLTSGKTRPSDLADTQTEDRPFPVLGGNGVMGFSHRCYVDAPRTLIIGPVGEYCGAVHTASGKIWITDNALYAKEWLSPHADLEFVATFLEYFDLNRFKRMAGQPLVTQGMISEQRIPLPLTVDEQLEITSIFSAIDRKIELHGNKRAVLDKLFKSLLHKLMIGEIRVADLDLSALAPTRVAEAAQ